MAGAADQTPLASYSAPNTLGTNHEYRFDHTRPKHYSDRAPPKFGGAKETGGKEVALNAARIEKACKDSYWKLERLLAAARPAPHAWPDDLFRPPAKFERRSLDIGAGATAEEIRRLIEADLAAY